MIVTPDPPSVTGTRLVSVTCVRKSFQSVEYSFFKRREKKKIVCFIKKTLVSIVVVPQQDWWMQKCDSKRHHGFPLAAGLGWASSSPDLWLLLWMTWLFNATENQGYPSSCLAKIRRKVTGQNRNFTNFRINAKIAICKFAKFLLSHAKRKIACENVKSQNFSICKICDDYFSQIFVLLFL